MGMTPLDRARKQLWTQYSRGETMFVPHEYHHIDGFSDWLASWRANSTMCSAPDERPEGVAYCAKEARHQGDHGWSIGLELTREMVPGE